MKNIDIFKEGLYSPIDTIGDFFSDSLYLEAIEKYKILMMDASSNEMRYRDYLPGDILREIFNSDENLSQFLLILKENSYQNINDITKVITFILACEQARRSIDNTPCSIQEIFSQKILDIMQTLGQEEYPPEDEVEEGEIYWSHQDGLHQLDIMGFPIISEYGVPVYFLDTTENPEIVYVWSKNMGIVKYNKKGEIITEIITQTTPIKQKREIPHYLRAVESLPNS